MRALFTLNIERFLALTCPFFHLVFVTRTRLVSFLVFFSILALGLSPLLYINRNTMTIFNILIAICISFMLFLSTYANCKMFVIAKSKRVDKKVAPSTETSKDKNRKKRTINLKNISTCSLAVFCYFLCYCPCIIYLIFIRMTLGGSLHDKDVLLLNLWSSTFISINSTLNCAIFFWRTSVLRREGMKIVKALNSH